MIEFYTRALIVSAGKWWKFSNKIELFNVLHNGIFCNKKMPLKTYTNDLFVSNEIAKEKNSWQVLKRDKDNDGLVFDDSKIKWYYK